MDWRRGLDRLGVVFLALALSMPAAAQAQTAPPPPSAEDVQFVPPLGLDVDLRLVNLCERVPAYRVAVSWRVVGGDPDEGTPPPQVVVSLDVGEARADVRRFDGEAGEWVFDANTPQGANALLFASVTSGGETAHVVRGLVIPPCTPPPPPISDFVAPDDPGSPPIGLPPGPLLEADVAHLGGSIVGSPAPVIVTATGTGAGVRLDTWTVDSTGAPSLLQPGPVVVGHTVRLHTLAPEVSPDNVISPFVMGIIRDGVLWLSTYQSDGTGVLTEIDRRGYMVDPDTAVVDFGIDDYRVGSKIYVLSTVLTSAGRLRNVTWRVDAGDGSVAGLFDGGDGGTPSSTTSVDVDHLGDGLFVVGYVNTMGIRSSSFVEVLKGSGFPVDRGGGAIALDRRRADYTQGATAAAQATLGDGGFLAVSLDGADPLLETLEPVVAACDGGCFLVPARLSSSARDLQPGPGVEAELPELTDSRLLRAEAQDRFGSALATGDFDGDGFTDLAVGAPAEDLDEYGSPAADGGIVQVLYGGPGVLGGPGREQVWHQDSPGIAGLAEDGDNFGAALAAGDFDGDGYDDLAVGVPLESIGQVEFAGAVNIIYGSASGLTAAGDLLIHQDSSGIKGVAEVGDRFGAVLVAGDFGFGPEDDLAIGVPGEAIGSRTEAGAVQIVFGSPSGLSTADQFWHQDSPGIKGKAESFDRFGASLAAGPLFGSSRDDLVIGVPGEDSGSTSDTGAVHVLRATNSGLTASGDQLWSQASSGVKGANEAGDQFGWAVGVGDTDGDGSVDLIVGIPGEDVGDLEDAGAVSRLPGGPTGPSADGDEMWHLGNAPGIAAQLQAGSRLGFSVATYDDGVGAWELLVGAPGHDVEVDEQVQADAGMVWRFGEAAYKSADPEPFDKFGWTVATGLFDGLGFSVIGTPFEDVTKWKENDVSDGGDVTIGGQYVYRQADPYRPRAIVTDADREQLGGEGSGALFSQGPLPGEPVAVHIASVTKLLTLDLAVDAIEQGTAALDDVVTISATAAGRGGSHMDPLLETGDKMSLELLLHGMIMPSGNKASVAIAEHLAGSIGAFAAEMNARAAALSMDDTVCASPEGGCLSTPQDQVNLWIAANERPLWRQVASETEFAGCGLTAANAPKCYLNLKKSDLGYVGVGAWKGGNGGFSVPGQTSPPIWCTACISAGVTRLQRTFVAAIQQSGKLGRDTRVLFDYAIDLVFTPDDVAATARAGAFAAHGMDTVATEAAVTVTVDGGSTDYELCIWFVAGDSIETPQCATQGVAIPAGPAPRPLGPIDVELLATAFSMGDYIVTRLDAASLEVELRRVDDQN